LLLEDFQHALPHASFDELDKIGSRPCAMGHTALADLSRELPFAKSIGCH
jgi:hypothetical protein